MRLGGYNYSTSTTCQLNPSKGDFTSHNIIFTNLINQLINQHYANLNKAYYTNGNQNYANLNKTYDTNSINEPKQSTYLHKSPQLQIIQNIRINKQPKPINNKYPYRHLFKTLITSLQPPTSLTIRSMSDRQTIVKRKIFSIPHYTQSISQYHEQLHSLEPQQHRQIKHSRYGKQFLKINQCQKHDYETRKIDCLKEALHSFCEPEFKGFIDCLDRNKNKKECDGNVGLYFVCVERNMKNVYWSGAMYL